SPENARRQVEHLEVQALANPDPSFHFALLTDFTDAPEQDVPGDAAILAAAREAIRDLNSRWRGRHERVGGDGVPAAGDRSYRDRLFLLHRDRLWNATEGVWMGWERKRGKLEELNELL